MTLVWLACLLVGHDDMVMRAPGRLWLRCNDCGRDTPGWLVGRSPSPTDRAATDVALSVLRVRG